MHINWVSNIVEDYISTDNEMIKKMLQKTNSWYTIRNIKNLIAEIGVPLCQWRYIDQTIYLLLKENLACPDTNGCYNLRTSGTNTKAHCTDFN